MPFRFNPLTGKLDLVDVYTPPPGDELSVTTDAGVATSVGDAMEMLGGTGVTTSGAGDTVTISVTQDVATTYSTDAGDATPSANKLNVNGGANINTAGAADTVTVNLDTDVVTNSYATDTAATNVKIEDNTITAGGTNANVDIGIIPKGTGGAYVVNNLTVGQSSAQTSIPFGGGSLDVVLFADTEGAGDLAGVVENRHTNIAGFGCNYVMARSRGTHALPTLVQGGDNLGRLAYLGYDGAEYVLSAGIVSNATGTPAAGVVPSEMIFATTDSLGSFNTAMTIDDAQVVSLTNPLPIGSGGTNATTFTQSAGIVVYNGTSLVNYAGPQINSSGEMTNTTQPSFKAYLSADVANATGDGTAYVVAFNTESWDQGGDFAANTFTAPVTGKYRFSYTISVDDLLVGHTSLLLSIGGIVVERCNPYAVADASGFCLLSGAIDLALNAADTVTMSVTVSGSTKTVTVKGTTASGTYLSGQLQV